MSLRKNTLASYATQFYVTPVRKLIWPGYLRYMDPEA